MYKERRLGAVLLCAVSLCGFQGSLHAAPISGQGSWETTLLPRDLDGNLNTVEAYYDTLVGITWMADAQFAGSTMNFADANNYISGLNTSSLFGLTGWRMPTLSPINPANTTLDDTYAVDGTTDLGYNITAPGTAYAGSTAHELAHMFYNTLANLAYRDINDNVQPGWGLNNTGPFANLMSFFYWTDTPYWPATANPNDPPPGAWTFFEDRGSVNTTTVNGNFHVWVVHDGDIGTVIDPGTNPVPVPPAVWLFGSGLLAMVGIARRRK